MHGLAHGEVRPLVAALLAGFPAVEVRLSINALNNFAGFGNAEALADGFVCLHLSHIVELIF